MTAGCAPSNVDSESDSGSACERPPGGTRLVAVVAIGRNEGSRLRRCILSVPRNLRLIYVDSGSTDGSVAFARTRGAEVVDLDTSLPFTAARARHAGVSELVRSEPRVPYVQFVDGDCEIELGWLEDAVAFLDANPEVAVVCGRRRERYPERSIYNQLCDAEWDTPIGEADACGGDSMMRLRAYEEAGGFKVSVLAGEEPELCCRIRSLGYKVWRLDRPMTIHDADLTRLAQWWRRAVRGGYGYAQVFKDAHLYRRELIRAVGWAAALPITTALLSALVSPWFLLLLLLPFAQIIRLAAKWGGNRQAWGRATFMLVAKVPEFLGIIKFVLESITNLGAAPRSYK